MTIKVLVVIGPLKIVVDVPQNIRVIDFKRKLVEKTGDPSIYSCQLFFNGEILEPYENLSDYDIEEHSKILVKREYIPAGPAIENNNYSTNICAVDKRGNVGMEFFYKIKGSNEGTVWGDHIYTDDSNIAKAVVLEGKCQLGQEKIVGIKMIEGKSSYSSVNKNGVSSVTWGSWPASYVFVE